MNGEFSHLMDIALGRTLRQRGALRFSEVVTGGAETSGREVVKRGQGQLEVKTREDVRNGLRARDIADNVWQFYSHFNLVHIVAPDKISTSNKKLRQRLKCKRGWKPE
jgi:hypothetical protein